MAWREEILEATMVGRLIVLALVGVLSVAALMTGPLSVGPADADAQIFGLKVSTGMSDKFEPTGDVGIEFAGDNNGVFVTFAYRDLPSGSGLSRIVRFNGDDYNWDDDLYGRLKCCPNGGSGRYR